MTLLSTSYYSLGDFVKANEFLQHALQNILATQGPNHSDVFMIKQRIGAVALETEDFDEAQMVLNEAWEGQKRMFGEKDLDTRETMKLLKRIQKRTTTKSAKKRCIAATSAATT
jgi:hypothetical protein